MPAKCAAHCMWERMLDKTYSCVVSLCCDALCSYRMGAYMYQYAFERAFSIGARLTGGSRKAKQLVHCRDAALTLRAQLLDDLMLVAMFSLMESCGHQARRTPEYFRMGATEPQGI